MKIQYLVEGITKDIVAYLMQDNIMDLPSAINLFHNSETFEKLSDESNVLYIESSAYVYKYLSRKLRWGEYYKDKTKICGTCSTVVRVVTS